LRPSARVIISRPRNNFQLTEDALQYVFVAGGIGITPIVPMLRAAEAAARPFQLIYCSRRPEATAFLELAHQSAVDGRALVHHDEGRRDAQLDFNELLGSAVTGTHLYCCGPNGLMEAVRRATSTWPTGTVHFEYFVNPLQSTDSTDKRFEIELRKSGMALDVPADRSILEILRENGLSVDSSCESGLCGTCKTRYLAGMPDHRDLILDDHERTEFLMVCCSRARSERLVLDL